MTMKWIEKAERLPEQQDANEWGCVIVWHTYQGVMVTGWRNAKENSFVTHWMHAIPGPCQATQSRARDGEISQGHREVQNEQTATRPYSGQPV